MFDRANIVYRYDGTYLGLLCCVAQCCNERKLPQAIELLEECQGTLFQVREILTSPPLARQVERSVREQISPQVQDMFRRGYLTCMEEKEMRLLRFLLLGYQYGPKVADMSLNEDVHAIDKALLYLKNEAHYCVEFLRFTNYRDFLGATLTPNNRVLPLIVGHFTQRFNTENFLIYDKTHGMAFFHETGEKPRGLFFLTDALELPEVDAEEMRYEALWQQFYDSVAVEGRINPELRRGNMPMRYWPNMTEFQRDAPKI